MEKKPESRIEILNRVSKQFGAGKQAFEEYVAEHNYEAILSVVYISMAQYRQQELSEKKQETERLQVENKAMAAEIESYKEEIESLYSIIKRI